MELKCQFWDVEAATWSTEGLTPAPPPNNVPDGFLYCDAYHLTEFGGISIPTSAAELLAELTPTFNTFTLEEAFDVLSQFNIAEYPLLSSVIFTMIGLDLITLCFLGVWRRHRKHVARKRENKLFEEEKLVEEVRQVRIEQLKQSGSKWSRLRLEVMQNGAPSLIDFASNQVDASAASKRLEVACAAAARWSKLSTPRAGRRSSRASWSSAPDEPRAGTGELAKRNSQGETGKRSKSLNQASLTSVTPGADAVQLMSGTHDTMRLISAECVASRQRQAEVNALVARSVGHKLVLSRTPAAHFSDRTIQERICHSRSQPNAAATQKTVHEQSLHAIPYRATPAVAMPNQVPTVATLLAARQRMRDYNAMKQAMPNQVPTVATLLAARQRMRDYNTMNQRMRGALHLHQNVPSRRTGPPSNHGSSERVVLPSRPVGSIPCQDKLVPHASSELGLQAPPSPPSSPPCTPSSSVWCAGNPPPMPPSVRRAAKLRREGRYDHAPQALRHPLAQTARNAYRAQAVRRAQVTPSRSLSEGPKATREQDFDASIPLRQESPIATNVKALHDTDSITPMPERTQPSNALTTGSVPRPVWAEDVCSSRSRALVLQTPPRILPAQPVVQAGGAAPYASAITLTKGPSESTAAETTDRAPSGSDPGDIERTQLDAQSCTATSEYKKVLSPGQRPFIRARTSAALHLVVNTGKDLKTLKARTVKKKVREKIRLFLVAFCHGFRTDHTLVGFLAPASDDEALNEIQVVQLFWFLLMFDLYINAVQYSGPDDPSAPISPINDIINGLIAAVLTMLSVLFLRAIFRWGNKRKLADRRSHLRRLAHRWAKAFRSLRRVWTAQMPRVTRTVKRTTRLCTGIRVIPSVRHIIERSEERTVELTKEAGAPAGVGLRPSWNKLFIAYVEPGSALSGSVLPGDQLVAIDGVRVGAATMQERQQAVALLCASSTALLRVRRTLADRDAPTRARLAPSPPPSPPSDPRVEEDSPATTTAKGPALLKKASCRAMAVAQQEKLGVSELSPSPSTARVLRGRALLKQAGGRVIATSKQVKMRERSDTTPGRQSASGAQLSLAQQALARSVIQHFKSRPPDPVAMKRKEVRLRSDCAFYTRVALAWSLNLAAYGITILQVIIYAGLFGPSHAANLVKTWLLSLGMVLGIIEPFNIFLLAALPLLVAENGCCARCYNRIFLVYNEFFA